MLGPFRLLLVVAVALLALTAEGTPAEPQVVELDTAGFRFNPREIEVTRGRPVRFVVTAKDSPHAFSIPDLELEEVVLPGERRTIEVTFEGEGPIAFRCRFHHRQGMVGIIRVQGEGSSRPPEDGPRGAGGGADSIEPGFPRGDGS